MHNDVLFTACTMHFDYDVIYFMYTSAERMHFKKNYLECHCK